MRLNVLIILSLVVGSTTCRPDPSIGDGDGDADGDSDGDADSGTGCEPGVIDCDGATARRCNDSGDGWVDEQACADPTPVCVDELGCLVCAPLDLDCDGDTPISCNSDGSAWDRGEPCDTAGGQQCITGHCTDPCSAAAETNSYVGCEYWAVDLPNGKSSQNEISPDLANFDVVISNGHESATATVRVYFNGDDDNPVLTVTVPPSDLRKLGLNDEIAPSTSSISGTGVHEAKAFHIVSNLPVTAYQFNPLNNTEAAYSNDASLLLPVNGLGTDYIAVTGDAVFGGDGDNWGAFITVVAIEDGTEVTVTPTSALYPGSDISGSNPVTVQIDRFDLLNLESLDADGGLMRTNGNGNLSGSYVHASKNVAVFAGNVGTIMPYNDEGMCCADHLEEQLIPLSSWGQRFVVGRGMPRRIPSDPEKEFYRITGGNPTAGQDAIHISYSPFTPPGAPTELGQGESTEFSATEDFVVTADGPIMVASFFVSSFYSAPEIEWSFDPLAGRELPDVTFCLGQDACNNLPYAAVCFQSGCQPVGDPAMTLIPPVEQFRDEYIFLAPDDYMFDAITVIAPMNTVVHLDGSPITEPMVPVGEIDGTDWGVCRTLVTDGTHRLVAENAEEVGLIVYGMDKDVSYSYPGGLDLEIINFI